MLNPWKILLVEDNEDDYLLTRLLLSETKGSQFILDWMKTYDQALEQFEAGSHDAILLDYDLRGYTGLELAHELISRGCRTPIILLTGQGSYEIDVEAMRTGVADYLNKNEVNALLLERTIRYAIERKQAEEALRHANELLAQTKEDLEIRVQERTLELSATNTQLAEVNQELINEISERKRAEEQLREYTTRIEALAELSQLLSQLVPDFELILSTITQKVAEVIGDACVVSLLSEDEKQIKTMAVHHPDIEREKLIRNKIIDGVRSTNEGLRAQVIREGQPLLLSRAEGTESPWPTTPENLYGFHSLMIVPLQFQGEVIGTLGASRDQQEQPYTREDLLFLQDLATRAALAITNAKLFQKIENELVERKRVEAELAEIQRRLIDSSEAERLYLAQELHDGPMQELYGLIYQLSSLNDYSEGESGSEPIEAFNAKLQQVIRSLREIAGELRPPTLAPFGLEKAIRSHIESTQQTQPELHVELDLTPDGQILPERVRLALFRIYQVALTNVVRHAQAQHIWISFKIDDERATLEVKDDGCGFTLSNRMIEMARRGHLGLVGANERAQAVGGKMQVISKPGEGTLVRVAVPRKGEEELAEASTG